MGFLGPFFSCLGDILRMLSFLYKDRHLERHTFIRIAGMFWDLQGYSHMQTLIEDGTRDDALVYTHRSFET
ncbi:predicted protein [Pyrenophora tritici-repentis Pt-1C-BFP]|uniref:Uncharacterized protein n=1 Tax=Pyrenophora tritici-repentis (strain Pt-1C-BFP) TaxID=426418 RepID=B2WDA9_PYRTR|nr:uncharacterized protein PTRG_07968 [Pyrenophora tritici-repentis Pt-1C-BFP]EDU50887.1 predicted protein [Pyrenophora tritici-repentis Pt-1C-BFP]